MMSMSEINDVAQNFPLKKRLGLENVGKVRRVILLGGEGVFDFVFRTL
jgi:hypothetical protein